MQPDLLSRFRGCLLGLAVGDAVGSPFEGLDAYGIYSAFGGARRIVAKPPVEGLTYTDDTQMMIAVAEALLRDGRIDEASLMAAFVENFDAGRGYGQGTRRLVETARDGGDWVTLSHTLLPGGSLGNGGAMRVAPVGLLFHRDLDRVWSEARASALPTHRHPVGVEGAQLIALAVALAARGNPFDRTAWFDQLLARAVTEEFRYQLKVARDLGPTDPFDVLGSSLRADQSVVAAIACFASSPDSYSNAIARAIAMGDDTDTVAAMAGAISGAYLGVDAVPAHLLAMLEDGVKGRGYIEQLAGQLADLVTPKPLT
jgi:poly(ADP-ribose) glycohydrolase ARH3